MKMGEFADKQLSNLIVWRLVRKLGFILEYLIGIVKRVFILL
jgi:hypothetical protein